MRRPRRGATTPAIGGAAFASDFAVGGDGSAAHFNDDAARAVLLVHPLKLGMDWCVANMRWVQAVILAAAFTPTLAMLHCSTAGSDKTGSN